jgi:hypothetical protein
MNYQDPIAILVSSSELLDRSQKLGLEMKTSVV